MSGQTHRFGSLRWQLWTSHVTVVVITLVSLVGCMLLLAGAVFLRQGVVLREPAQDAQLVAVAVGNLVRRGGREESLSLILSELRQGGVRVPVAPFEGERGPRWAGGPAFRSDLGNLDYIVVIGLDRRVIASTDRQRFPPGSLFPPDRDPGWEVILPRAVEGVRDADALSFQRDSLPAIGAYPISDFVGRPIAIIALAKQETISRDILSIIARGVAAFGVVSTVVLAVSSIFAVTFSALAAYLLARRLVGRLESLSRAAEGITSGDLSQRVEPGDPDEVGQLGQRFNAMAARLQESVAALEVERDRAEQALRTRQELVANVSHELRTPLASIRGHVESLAMARESDHERLRQYLEVIERESVRLGRLIDDLFNLSAAEAGAQTVQSVPLRLTAVAQEVLESLAPVARTERQVTLVSALEPDLPAVLADERRLSQVLQNLLRNALRYTAAGGLISLSAIRKEAEVEVTVADTGVGIPPDELPHVFERFYRADPAQDRASGGAGLGLAIVREFVEAMGGRVSVESVIGEGSRFSFTLLVADQTDQVSPQQVEAEPSPPSLAGKAAGGRGRSSAAG